MLRRCGARCAHDRAGHPGVLLGDTPGLPTLHVGSVAAQDQLADAWEVAVVAVLEHQGQWFCGDAPHDGVVEHELEVDASTRIAGSLPVPVPVPVPAIGS